MPSCCLTALFVVLCAFASLSSATEGWSNCSSVFPDPNFVPYQVPDAVRICREGVIAISYDTDMINPAYSAYLITQAECEQTISGRDDFYEDPDLKAMGIVQGKTDSHAYNATYNKGHCAPSRAMGYSDVTKKACYTMANVAPQEYKFNQVQWQHLETAVYDWIKNNGTSLYIITGVLYNNRSAPSRTWDGIAVPDYYFKVICDYNGGMSAGFVGANAYGGDGTAVFRPVADVEAMFGGPLFPSACNTGTVDPSYFWG